LLLRLNRPKRLLQHIPFKSYKIHVFIFNTQNIIHERPYIGTQRTLSKLKINKIILNIFFDQYNKTRNEIKRKNFGNSINPEKLNNLPLTNQWIRKENKKEILKLP
jgi:hypothetical protein